MAVTLPEVFAGRYQIVRKLGEGGMGAVYLAEDTRMHRRVALKVPQFTADESPATIERFQREARVASGLRHPGLCPVYDVDCVGGIHFLTMAFIEGRPLADYVRSGQPWPLEHAVALLTHLATALKVLHDQGVVHRDLKPANIMIQPDGTPVLLDFGLARSVASESQRLTATGTTLGTPAYMAPEQIGGASGTIGPWTDVYSLGVILFQLLTGRLPFDAPSMVALYGQILCGERPRPSSLMPTVGAGLDQLCVRTMAIKQEQRPQGMVEFMNALRQVVVGPTAVMDLPAPVVTPVQDGPTQTLASPVGVNTIPAEEATLTCPACSRRVKVPAKLLGRRVRCPRCRASLGQAPSSPQGPPRPGDTEALAEVVEVLDVPGDRRKRERPPQRGGGSKWVVLIGGLACLLVLGLPVLGLVYWLSSEPTPTSTMKEPEFLPPTMTNSVGMQFVLIPAGRFEMGSPAWEAERLEHEGPRHEVEITRAFYMGTYEVTQYEYKAVMGNNPSWHSAQGGGVKGGDTSRYPVETVNWDEAVAFCKALSDSQTEKQAGRSYRLPTEAEWEYACRGGSSSQVFHYGNSLTSDQANVKGEEPYGGALALKSVGAPVAVGSYRPNAWGLYDMHGNVEEWCGDWYDPTFYQTCVNGMIRQAPQGPASSPNNHRILRGGSWYEPATVARSAYRRTSPPGDRYTNFGFRVVCTVTR